MPKLSSEEKAKAWEVAAGYLDFAAEWSPDSHVVSEAEADRIIEHLRTAVQPSLTRRAEIIRKNARK